MKNIKIIGIVSVIGIIGLILGIIFTVNFESDSAEVENALDREVKPYETPQVQEKYEELQIDNNSNYKIRDREWRASGPFQIDRSEYAIGEKIFIRMGGLQIGEKGDIAVMRPLNDTHTKFYLSIPFDETKNPTFNQYFEPAISKNRGICSVDDLDGTWFLVFRGTEYLNLEFKINKELGVVGGTDTETVC
ncbi:MAG: hypothetical protein COA77_07820 [Thaumarchaeota archaeon]|nr:MAG: hypothetical protein COA77_07820 [Nitrososphaerota archaeon]